jgi:hypothetical protein
VPAQVAGRWHFLGGPAGLTVQLTQQFQKIEGTATVDDKTVPLQSATLRGDEIEFTVTLDTGKPLLFRGKVDGDTMEARAQSDGAVAGWSAVRTSPAPATTPAVIRSRG